MKFLQSLFTSFNDHQTLSTRTHCVHCYEILPRGGERTPASELARLSLSVDEQEQAGLCQYTL